MTKNKSLQMEEGKIYPFYVHNVKDGKGGYPGSIDVKASKGASESFTVSVKKAELGERTLASLKHKMVNLICRNVDGKLRLCLADEKTVGEQAAATAKTVAETPAAPAQTASAAPATTAPDYEVGKEYALKVFQTREEGKVDVWGGTAPVYEIKYSGVLKKKLSEGCPVTVRCTGVGTSGPVFELAKSCFETPQEAVKEKKPSPQVPGASAAAYKVGKEYMMKIFYTYPADKTSANKVDVQDENKRIYSIEFTGELIRPFQVSDVGKAIQVVCKQVVEDKIVFDLPKSYYRTPAQVIDRMEDSKTEFKSSIIFSPQTDKPDVSQPRQIAKEIAAFMNSAGGELFLGIKDYGVVVGIENDLPHLNDVHTPLDERYSYRETPDAFGQKLKNLIQYYLGNDAFKYLEDPDFVKVDGGNLTYVILKIKPSDEDIIYVRKDEIWVRKMTSCDIVPDGRERDKFVRERTMASFKQQLDAVRASVAATAVRGQETTEIVSAVRELLSRLDGLGTAGTPVPVSGGHPFTEEAVTAAQKPKALAWDGQHYAEVKGGWKELVLKVLEKLQELDAAKFDELANQKEFSRHLVKIQKPRERHPDCYETRFGQEGKIRIKASLGNKIYLWQEDKVLRKLIAAFGIDISRFMFVV